MDLRKAIEGEASNKNKKVTVQLPVIWREDIEKMRKNQGYAGSLHAYVLHLVQLAAAVKKHPLPEYIPHRGRPKGKSESWELLRKKLTKEEVLDALKRRQERGPND